MNKNIIIFALISLLSHITYGNLDFKYTTLKEEISPLVNEFYFTFPFENNSLKPIEIKNVSTSCYCILSKLEKKIYQPKEKGILYGILDISGRTGIQKQAVFLEIDSPIHSRINLTVEVNVKPIARIKPSLLFWNVDSIPSPKSSVVHLNPDFAKTISYIETDVENFNVNLIQDKEDKFKFEIFVNPQKTNKPLRRLICFHIKTTDGILKKHFIHAVIK